MTAELSFSLSLSLFEQIFFILLSDQILFVVHCR